MRIEGNTVRKEITPDHESKIGCCGELFGGLLYSLK